MKTINNLPKGFDSLAEAQQQKFLALKKVKDTGGRVVGLYCSYVPIELIYAAGAPQAKSLSALRKEICREIFVRSSKLLMDMQ